MAHPVRVIGLGGSLRAESTSLSALRVALDGSAAAGADTELVAVADLGLPLYSAEHAIPPAAQKFADAAYACDAMIWSSPTYQGSVSGSFKNVLDWLILLADRKPRYLSNKPVGLVTTAGGAAGLQAINTMDFIARSLRAWSVPVVLPVSQSWKSFDPDGRLTDKNVEGQLHELGAEVVRAARQFRAEGTCDYAEERQFAPARG
jgi:FMN reductase